MTSRRLMLRLMLGRSKFEIQYDSTTGFPIVDYGVRGSVCIGKRINPLHLALYACKQLRLEPITGPIMNVPRLKETESPEYVQRAASWLLLNEKNRGNSSVWEYDFPWPPAGLRPPWISALAEAFGALLLIATGRTNRGRRHLESMLIDYRDGGVALVGDDYLWQLELVREDAPLILNGMLHCLLILLDCSIRLHDPALKKAFDLGLKTLKRELVQFDAGFYTFYSSHKEPANQKYHRIHVELIRTLYANTRDQDLLPWLKRWTQFQKMYFLTEPVIFFMYLIRTRGRLTRSTE